ncbi:AbrB/MazE/SpoVT family DNA-binding domain-containing protein [Candidatus Woesearchaeota archaeon]|nr:AbrB/MazE/SpoVT family DNA-binding domain-containing protein [Candidatus Woesearchaeota archaeon]
MALQAIRTVTITGKGQVSIPKELRKRGTFAEGSRIAILSFDDHLELRPMSQVQKRLETAIASERALKDWRRKGEARAWKGL